MRIDDRKRHDTLNRRINAKGNAASRYVGSASYGEDGFARRDLHILTHPQEIDEVLHDESGYYDKLKDRYESDYNKKAIRRYSIQESNDKKAKNFLKDFRKKNKSPYGTFIYRNWDDDNKYEVRVNTGVSPKDSKKFSRDLKKNLSAADYANELLEKYL